MPQKTPQNLVSEHEIAQLLSGSLDDHARLGVLSRLAADPDARTLLRMALEALEVAESAERARSRPAA